MMQGSGRPQVSDEDAMSFVGAILGPRSSYPKNMKKPETARISPKISPNQPEIARYVSSRFVWAQHLGILFPSKISFLLLSSRRCHRCQRLVGV